MYNILILGSGGREHALAWKIRKSKKCNDLFIAPGNAGSRQFGENADLDILDFDQINEFVLEKNIDYIIVGPEAPLVEGIYDYFEDKAVKLLGPSRQSALLEGSKAFANDFMQEFDIPTAAYVKVNKNSLDLGLQFIHQQKTPIVLKADGLAAGKGVLIIDDKDIAIKELNNMIGGKFGKASETVVIEEFLSGIEFSVFVITDGEHYKLLPVAKDYKRIGEGDTGLNTGGMGAISPVSFADDELMDKVKSRIIEPTLKGLQSRKYTYKGFIFFGLISVQGDPYVIEYNCRLGDPETEVILPRLESDLMEIIESVFNGTLEKQRIAFDPRYFATVIAVSEGYPGSYEKGKEIRLPHEPRETIIFHAGTKRDENNMLLSNGGRVLAVSSPGTDKQSAVSRSLEVLKEIHFDGMYYRRDIGFDL